MNNKYVICRKHCNNRNLSDFISTLSHEYFGIKEIINCSDLDNALYFQTFEEAVQTLNSQPKWVQNKFKVISI
jgi:hypothetical protein